MDVTLEWDANTESDLAGYRIYYDTDSGPPYQGTGADGGDSPIDVTVVEVEADGKARYTLANLNDDETYFFAITAYNASNRESGYSDEVSTDENISTINTASGQGGGGCFLTTIVFE